MGGTPMNAPELYAALYVREFPAQAPLRLRAALREQPCAILDGIPPSEYVCAMNTKARTRGVRHGMTRVEVETISSVIPLARTPHEEAQARTIVQEVAGGFTPRIEACTFESAFLCVLDISGTESLFGPPRQLAQELLKRIRSLGMAATIAVSGNFHAAWCMARGMSTKAAITVLPQGKERDALAPLPLAILELNDAQMSTLSSWGISTLGKLATLPEKSLIARLGQDGKRLRQLAAGELPHLFQPGETPFTLREEMELDSPIELLDGLLFLLNLMLEQIIRRASDRILAVASVSVSLSLEGGATHMRTVSPPTPTNERALWLKLLQMELELHPPQAAILHVALEAEPGHISKVQLGLFSPQLPEPGRLEVTLARIAKIVGEDAVGQAVLRDTHQPRGFRMEKFRVPTTAPAPTEADVVRFALRELRPSEPITVQLIAGAPCSLRFRNETYRVESAYGPWVIGTDWWNQEHWGQAQWDLVLADASDTKLRCCIIRDLKKHCWQMAGFYD
ncbi:protein ImuB [Acidipila rosea]|uniref:Protein ImuB n=2 Tax=Acidipila rosea TaxID=768535 RepID=A0A4R1KUY2_9BACT|nr:protein ImuB [Acidipila rosea]